MKMKTCQRGHIYSEEKRQCPVCQRASVKAYKKRHPEQAVKYRKTHKDVRNQQSFRYRKRHPEKMKESCADWKRRNALYGIWVGMKERCYNPEHISYANYGGRGVMICPEWLGDDGYQNTVTDIPPRPSPRHTLDRINGRLGYSKENCKWSTSKEQVLNRSLTALVTICGVTKSKSEWARQIGISFTSFDLRIKMGWEEGKLLQPVNPNRQRNLGIRRRLENAVVKMFQVIGDVDYEGKEEIIQLLEDAELFSVATKGNIDG